MKLVLTITSIKQPWKDTDYYLLNWTIETETGHREKGLPTSLTFLFDKIEENIKREYQCSLLPIVQ